MGGDAELGEPPEPLVAVLDVVLEERFVHPPELLPFGRVPLLPGPLRAPNREASTRGQHGFLSVKTRVGVRRRKVERELREGRELDDHGHLEKTAAGE